METDKVANLDKIRNKRDLSFFDLYSVDQLTKDDLSLIYDVAREFRKLKTAKLSLNKGASMINAFFESSTRTLASFDLSAKQLSMDTTSVGSNSSIKKKESFLDTAETVDAMNVKIIVIRSAEAGVSEFISRHTKASVLNAGDGWHEHPTQALLDTLTMLDYFKSNDLMDKTVTIVGDIMHSRVFGSLVRLLKKLGAEIRVSAPDTLLPVNVEKFGVKVFYNVEEALKNADVVYALRVQEERGAKGFIPSIREYSKMYGISKKRLDLAKENAILMHPGPVIRDIDVHSALVTLDSRSHILQQVENGLAIRKTLLWLLVNRYDKREKEFTLK